MSVERSKIDIMAALEESLKPYPKAPPRGTPPPEIERAARVIHNKVWSAPYRRGEGPMTHAGGPHWHNELLRLADEWERLAAAARVAATWLPEEGRVSQVRLPGLRCETCGRVCYDTGGGRACYGGDGGPGKRCGTMRGIWLRAVVDGERS